jgi:hypothetical protein
VKSMKNKSKVEQEKAIREVMEIMDKRGQECGNKISEYLKKTYPKALVIPMYRSAIAIETDGYDEVIIHACGDPHCMGEEINDKTLKKWTGDWLIKGQRFGPTLYKIFGEKIDERNAIPL